MNTDHIISNSQTRCMECQHCGFTQAIKMPVPLDDLLSQFDAFMDAHKDCKRPPSEAVMSEYIKGFDHGCDYIVAEIERHMKEVPNTEQVLAPLLRHLKGEGLGKVPTTKSK